MLEIQILDGLQLLHNSILDPIMIGIIRLGDKGLIWMALAIVLLIIPKTRKAGIIVSLALVFDVILCNGIIKPMVARPRPFTINPAIQLLIEKPDDYSFPSGHTAASFATVFGLYFAGKNRIANLCLVLACLIAFSRLYLYVHFPTDVLAGVVVGLVCGALSAIIINPIAKARAKKKERKRR